MTHTIRWFTLSVDRVSVLVIVRSSLVLTHLSQKSILLSVLYHRDFLHYYWSWVKLDFVSAYFHNWRVLWQNAFFKRRNRHTRGNILIFASIQISLSKFSQCRNTWSLVRLEWPFALQSIHLQRESHSFASTTNKTHILCRIVDTVEHPREINKFYNALVLNLSINL